MSIDLLNSIVLSIPTSITKSDSEGKYTAFVVRIQTRYSSWEVHRRYREFHTLNDELHSTKGDKLLPQFPKKKVIGVLSTAFVEERREALEGYLKAVLRLEKKADLYPIVKFLEDGNQVFSLQLQLAGMNDRLDTATDEIRRAAVTMEMMNERIIQLEKQVAEQNSLSNSNLSNELSLNNSAHFSSPDSINNNISSDKSNNNLTFGGNVNGLNNQSQLSTELSQQHGANSDNKQSLNRLSTDASTINSNANASTASTVRPEGLESPKPGYFLKQVLGFNLDSPGGVNIQPDHALLETKERSSDGFQESVFDFPMMAENSKGLENIKNQLNGIASTESGTKQGSWDRLADEVILMIQPQENQIQYRSSVSRYIGGHSRRILSAQIYEIGLQGLKCFLPDDPLRMSVFISRKDEALWYVTLNEQMCRLSGGIVGKEGATSSFQNEFDHSLSNVSFVSNKEAAGHKLQCLVDSSIGIEIVANARLELCILGFFEDFDRLLGKNHLFKRSILLIRAWWVYEAEMTVAYGLSDSALCTMILSILNRFHTKIDHPFQALSYFLAEYSTFDFSNHIITYYGPVEYDQFSTSANVKDTSECLMTTEFVDKYRKLTLAIDDDESSAMELLSESIGDSSAADAIFASNRILSNQGSNTLPNVCELTRKPIMIAHPLLPGLLFDLPASVLRRKAGLIVDALRLGSKSLVSLFTENDSGEKGFPESHGKIESFFQNIVGRFGRGWRPDVPISTGSGNTPILRESSVDRLSNDSTIITLNGVPTKVETHQDAFAIRDLFWISLDKTWDRIKYCNLLLESQISETALKSLSILILTEKGVLPVGEIGKMLQEACSQIQNMSAVLKERYGGLKKFLESYPDDFLLANDHPFNPNVYLPYTLTPEEHNMILRGDSLPKPVQYSNLKTKKNQRNPTKNSLGKSKKTPSPSFHSGDAMNMNMNMNMGGGMNPMGNIGYNGRSSMSSIGAPSRTFSSDAINRLVPNSNYGGGNGHMNNNNMNNNGMSNTGRYHRSLGMNNYQPQLDEVDQGYGSASIMIQNSGTEWEYRSRRASTGNTPDTSHGGLGILGLPDPSAPEFIPSWGMNSSNSTS